MAWSITPAGIQLFLALCIADWNETTDLQRDAFMSHWKDLDSYERDALLDRAQSLEAA